MSGERLQVAKRARLRYDQTRDAQVLLLPERVVMLSESAAEILALCDGSRTLQEIVDELGARYPDAELEADVNDFLGEALSRRWLEVTTPATTEQ